MSADPSASPTVDTGAPPAEPDAPAVEPRPLIERLGLAAIALVVTALFGAITLAALGAGELFLGAMAGIGAAMTLWAAAGTLRRG